MFGAQVGLFSFWQYMQLQSWEKETVSLFTVLHSNDLICDIHTMYVT